MRKNLMLLSFTLMVGMELSAQQVKVEASETIELMSIMARTAGYREYHMDMAGIGLSLVSLIKYASPL